MIRLMRIFSREKAVDGLFYSLGVVLAFFVKQHYSHSDADDLLWVLTPVAGLVEWFGHIVFTYEPYTGFINREHGVIIAPACAGVNLLIVSFTMALFSGIGRLGGVRKKVLWCCFSVAAAYVMVVFVNALRIYLSVIVFSADIENGWWTAHRCHRLLGIVIYFFFHCLFYHIMTRAAERYGKKAAGRRQGKFFYDLTPLGWYLGITLMVPFLNGAYRGNPGQFGEHALFVVSAGVALSVLFVFVQTRVKNLMIPQKSQGILLNETKNPDC